jgi:isopentenyl-diphosphate delta-isomerase
MKEYVVLVDKDGRHIGTEEKIAAHKAGLLHRAFSTFIFNTSGLLLIQKRSPNKYHCGNLWSNTCCSHPKPDETLEEAIHRRLKEEMGFDCILVYLDSFIYSARFNNGLIENEVDHVYYGVYDGKIEVNPMEVSDYKWIEPENLIEDIGFNHSKYTPWLKPALKIILAHSSSKCEMGCF